MKKTFEEIVNSVSAKDAENYSRHDKVHDTVALFARFISKAHVGWDTFPSDLKTKFESEVENLYNSPPASETELLKAMEIILVRAIPDNHSSIVDDKGKRILSADESQKIKDKCIDKYPETHVGKNTVFTLHGRSDCAELCFQQKGKDAIGIFEKKDADDNTIGIVSLSRCPQPDDKSFDLDNFLLTFNERIAKWNSVVLDVRGNEGGNSYVLNEISRRLYGDDVVFYESQTMRMTPEAEVLQKQKYNPDFIENLHKKVISAEFKITGKPETKFNPEKGYGGNIYVLADRKTSSSAEFVFGLHKHPKVRFVGENSCGCGEYGDTAMVKLPCGGALMMGIWHNRMYCQIKEGAGYKPTNSTEYGCDAFSHCLEIDKAEHLVQNKLESIRKRTKLDSQKNTNIITGKAPILHDSQILQQKSLLEL